MATLRVGNTTVGKISVVEPYEGVFDAPQEYTYKPDVKPWVRPSEWLDMPTINPGDEKVAMLLAVPSGEPISVLLYIHGTEISSNIRPTYSTIDWGDGNSELVYGRETRWNYNSETNPYIQPPIHEYNFDDLPSSTEFILNGMLCRQTIIEIDNSVSGLQYFNIAYMNDGYVRNPTGNYPQAKGGHHNNVQTSTLLDLHVESSNLTEMPTINHNGYSRHYNVQRMVINSSGNLKYCSRMFQEMFELQSVSYPSGMFSDCTSFYHMFSNCRKLSEIPPMDTSSATELQGMFYNCNSLVELPEGLNTASVTGFYSTFNECYSLKEFPNLDYSNGTNFSATFARMYQIRDIPSGLDFSKAEYTNSMFAYGHSLEVLPVRFLDQMSGVVQAASMFQYCPKLRNFGGPINLPSCTHMVNFANNCGNIEEIHLGDLRGMKNAPYGNNNLGFRSAFAGCTNNRKITVDYPEDCWSYKMDYMFQSNHKLTHIPYINTASGSILTGMFNGCITATDAPIFDLTSAINFDSFYSSCRSLSKVGGFTGLKDNTYIGSGNNFSYGHQLFFDCWNLREFPSGLFESGVPTPSYCRYMFYKSRITELPDIYISGAESTSTNNAYMFGTMYHLNKLGNFEFASGCRLRGFMTGNVQIMGLPDWDVGGVDDFTAAFNTCRSLRWSDIRNTSCDIGYNDCHLSSGALTNIFNNLVSGVTSKTIDIRNNHGISDLHPDTIAVATSKGWTVTT